MATNITVSIDLDAGDKGYGGVERFPLAEAVETVSLIELYEELSAP